MGQIANTSTYFGEDGTQLLVPGGAPAALSGPIHLCTRADNNNTRYFDGNVAYLGGALPLPVKHTFACHDREFLTSPAQHCMSTCLSWESVQR